MTQAELNELFKEATGLNGVQAKEYLARLGDIMGSELDAGGIVPLFGLGRLTVVQRAACKRRNPRTGESVDVPAKRAVKFKPGKELKTTLN